MMDVRKQAKPMAPFARRSTRASLRTSTPDVLNGVRLGAARRLARDQDP
jgi:hypothetical protein